MTDNIDGTLTGEVLKALNDELREHRQIFTEIRRLIGEQNVNLGKLDVTVEGLSQNISRYEEMRERLISLEQWKTDHNIEAKLEKHSKEIQDNTLWIAAFEGKLKIIIPIIICISSIIAYIADKLFDFFKSGAAP